MKVKRNHLKNLEHQIFGKKTVNKFINEQITIKISLIKTSLINGVFNLKYINIINLIIFIMNIYQDIN